MNEEGDSPKVRAVFRVCIWNQRRRAKSRSTELRMGSHGMRTHLASLTIPPQLGRTDSRKPESENRPHLQHRLVWLLVYHIF
jgi:hypothetical protein